MGGISKAFIFESFKHFLLNSLFCISVILHFLSFLNVDIFKLVILKVRSVEDAPMRDCENSMSAVLFGLSFTLNNFHMIEFK